MHVAAASPSPRRACFDALFLCRSKKGEGGRVDAVKYIGIRVPVALRDRIAALARQENNQISATARRLLTVALNLEDARDKPQPRKRVS